MFIASYTLYLSKRNRSLHSCGILRQKTISHITDTYKQKYDILNFTNHFVKYPMFIAVFIASTQMRFRSRTSDLIMLNQDDVGLPRGHWYVPWRS